MKETHSSVERKGERRTGEKKNAAQEGGHRSGCGGGGGGVVGQGVSAGINKLLLAKKEKCLK